MVGMEIKLYGVINEFGVYDGFFVNYSGVGFFYMCFYFYGLESESVFEGWVEIVCEDGGELSWVSYK